MFRYSAFIRDNLMAFDITARDKPMSLTATASQSVIRPRKVSIAKVPLIRIDVRMFSLMISMVLLLSLTR